MAFLSKILLLNAGRIFDNRNNSFIYFLLSHLHYSELLMLSYSSHFLPLKTCLKILQGDHLHEMTIVTVPMGGQLREVLLSLQ